MNGFINIAFNDLQEPLRKIMTLGSRLTSKYRKKHGEKGYHYIESIQKAAGKENT